MGYKVTFRGTFEYTLDAKNRLTVPAKFRAALSDGVVIAKGVERCAALWRPEDYDTHTAAALAGLNPLSPQARELNRFFSANAVDVELDAAGRVMLPPFIIEHASFERDVVVTGAGECLEIWNRSQWATYNEDLSVRVPEIAADLGKSA